MLYADKARDASGLHASLQTRARTYGGDIGPYGRTGLPEHIVLSVARQHFNSNDSHQRVEEALRILVGDGRLRQIPDRSTGGWSYFLKI